MPFRLQGAPATFQRLMDEVIRGLQDSTASYLDDLVCFSDSWPEHLEQVGVVFERLRAAGLTANPQKCKYAMAHCSYLGHVVGSGIVRPEETKLEAIRDFGRPVTKTDVRAFLGLSGYYRRFISNFAEVASPLSDLTKKAAPDKVVWNDSCEEAFKSLKIALCSAPVLHNPDFRKEFVLQTDASERGIGAVLSQADEDGHDHPVAYYSRKLLPREQNYSTVEKECLAVKQGMQAFEPYLIGRRFVVETDQRSLVWLKKSKEQNARLTRWSLSLQPFAFSVRHKPGRLNGNADGLSRTTQKASQQTSLLPDGD